MASMAFAALSFMMRTSVSKSQPSGCSRKVGFSSVRSARKRLRAGAAAGPMSFRFEISFNIDMAEQRTSNHGSSSSAVRVGTPATTRGQAAASGRACVISTSECSASPRTYMFSSRQASYNGAIAGTPSAPIAPKAPAAELRTRGSGL
jgi:hypothetical protein